MRVLKSGKTRTQNLPRPREKRRMHHKEKPKLNQNAMLKGVGSPEALYTTQGDAKGHIAQCECRNQIHDSFVGHHEGTRGECASSSAAPARSQT